MSHLVGTTQRYIGPRVHENRRNFGLVLAPAATKGYDATRPTGSNEPLKVEIKATQGDSVAFRHRDAPCDEVIVLRLDFLAGTALGTGCASTRFP